MRPGIRIFSFAAALATLAGCSVVPGLDPSEEHYYQLVLPQAGSPSTTPATTDARCEQSLALRPILANSFVGSRKIIFGSRINERGYYRFASWIEPPPTRLLSLLRASLESSQQFRSVSLLSTGARADLELSLELREFYHDTSAEPGVARIELHADLLELRGRSLVASKTFLLETPASQFSSEGAVTALSDASGKAVAELTEWLSSNCRVR